MKCVSPLNAGGQRVPCGKCISCRVNRGQEWSRRLEHELGFHASAIFLTLTYDGAHLPQTDSLDARHLQLFFKRLRFDLGKRRFRYYSVGEYGEKYNRPHYHGIFYGLSPLDREIIEGAWGMGRVHIGSVTTESINYVTKYVNKVLSGPLAREVYGDRKAPFSRMSKGLGLSWLKSNWDFVLQNGGLRVRGKPVRLPRYYLKKIGSDFPDELKNALTLLRSSMLDQGPLDDEESVHLWERDKESRDQVRLDLEALARNSTSGKL